MLSMEDAILRVRNRESDAVEQEVAEAVEAAEAALAVQQALDAEAEAAEMEAALAESENDAVALIEAASQNEAGPSGTTHDDDAAMPDPNAALPPMDGAPPPAGPSDGNASPHNAIPLTRLFIPDDLRGATIILGKDGISAQAIDWPHRLFFDQTTEGGAVCAVTVSKDGTHIAAGFEDTVVRVWDFRTSAVVLRLAEHEDTVWTTVFSPTENNKLASGSADRSAVIWDADDGSIYRSLKGHRGDVWSIAWSPDGKSIATGSVDGSVRIWDVENATTNILTG